MPTRRQFLATTGLAAAALSLPAAPDAKPAPLPRKPIKLGISSYSYWHFKTAKVPIETVIDKTARLGVEGVDILHRQMDLPEREPLTPAHRAHLRKLKRHAFTNGVAIICVSTHQSFVSPKPEEITRNVEHTQKCIEIAYELGAPCIRINTGRWGTSRNFDDLMANHGVEPILPGHTEDEGIKWCIDGLQRCLPKAEECGVILALENHWGLARTPEGLLRILGQVRSPWLGALMDTGNFLYEPYKEAAYAQLALMAPHTVFVQAKTYPGGGEWYDLKIDYSKIARILAEVNYAGYVSLEMEGKQDPDVAVPNSIEMLRKAFRTSPR